MKIAIRYFSLGGNTEKLANKIGEILNIPVLDVYEPLTEDVDLLFLCTSVYAAGVDDKVKEFINNINVKVGQVVNISTAAILPSTYKQVSKLLAKKGITMSPQEFHCRGSFGPLHVGHPNETDLKNLENFIKSGFDGINFQAEATPEASQPKEQQEQQEQQIPEQEQTIEQQMPQQDFIFQQPIVEQPMPQQPMMQQQQKPLRQHTYQVKPQKGDRRD